MGFTEKSDFYEGDSQKTNIEGRIVLKGGLAQFPNLRGLDKKEVGGVFEGDMGGGVIPQCTLCFISFSFSNILENKTQVFERSDGTITVHSDLYYNGDVI